MKQLILILLINSICIYAQSNETTTDDMSKFYHLLVDIPSRSYDLHL